MSAESNRELLIFTEALRLPAEARSDYLDRACAGDENLRHNVQALLCAHDRSGRFLEQPPSAFAGERVQQAGTIEKPGDWIGRYQLLKHIGEGGWGVVFLAEQKEPVRRQVALKVIKPGMDTKSVVARFEAERQALALMDHPYIAHVLDGGETQAGRPFFVMELVRGIKITEYCDQNSLATADRLELFIKVCDAIQYAHQKGVIHRDIKPSNILVDAASGGEAIPKVIDFGVVKATTGQRLTDETYFTANEMLIGTPAYMSPEQATNMDIDTRADIYSLGVLLYELLTGATPFDSRLLLSKGVNEIRRVISSEYPSHPSARLKARSAADLRDLSQRHRTDPAKLIREVRGDLDWIVMKALEKDRARRYATATGLALDVKRYLAYETVVARPPSQLYKFRKMVLRHKFAFAGITLFTLFLVVGLIVLSAALASERQALRNAQSEAAKSKQVTAILVESVQDIDPGVAAGHDKTMLRGILDGVVRRLGTGLTNQPEVQAELRATIGKVYRQIGLYERAEAMDRTALAIYQTLSPLEDAQTASTLDELGLALISRSNFPGAERAVKESLAISRRLSGNESPGTAIALHDLAHVYLDEGKYAEAELLIRQSLSIRLRLFDPESLEVADSLRNLAIILGDQGKWAEAEDTAQKVLAIRRKHLGSDDPSVASSLQDLAWAEGGQRGKLADAQALEREALEVRAKVLPEGHPEIPTSLFLLGDRLLQRGDLDDAYAILSSACSLQERNKDYGGLLPTLHSLGLTLEAEGKLPDAETVFRRRFDLWRKISETETLRASSEAEDLSRVLSSEGKLAAAEEVLTDSLTVRRHFFGDGSPETATALQNLAHVYMDEGKYSEAESLSRQSLSIRLKLFDPESLEVADSLQNLAVILRNRGEWAEAVDAAQKEIAIRRKRLGSDDPSVASALQDLAWTEGARGNLADAQALEREALEVRAKALPEGHPEIATALYLLGERLRQRGDFDDAFAVLNSALSMQQAGLGEDQLSALYTLRSLGWTLEGEGKLPDAEKAFRQGLDLWQKRKTRAITEQEGLARVLIAEHKFHDAEEFLDQTLLPDVVRESSSVDLLNMRANLLARQGRFQEAIADAALVAKYKPSRFEFYHPLAGLLAITDDRPALSNLCQKILITFTNVTSYHAMCMALDCLAKPDCGVDPAVADRLVDQALEQGKNDGSMPDFQACKALAQYRLGHFTNAIEWGQKPLKSYSDYARGKAYSVLAMTQWRLGNYDVARTMLSAAKTYVPDNLKGSAPDLGPEWCTWLFAWMQVNEATKLVKPKSQN